MSVYESSVQKLKKAHSKLHLSAQIQTDIKAAFVEAVANAVKHAQELKKKRSVKGHFFLNEKMIGFEVVDHGPGFNLKKIPVPDLSDFKASGRGIFMMKQLGDKLEYKKNSGHHVLIFGKNLMGQTKELDLLYNLSEAIIRRASLDEVYEIILGQALDIFHVERASILIYDTEKKVLKVAASRGMSKDVEKNIKVRSGEGVSGYVYQHGKPLLISDVKRNKQGIEQKKHYHLQNPIDMKKYFQSLLLMYLKN
jgi:anti-sigma regulatory factor (Ser/Thr protein kinase)